MVLSNARHTGILSAHLQLEQVGLGCGESCGYQGRGCCPQVGSARARNCQGTLGARLGSRPTPGGAGAAPGCTGLQSELKKSSEDWTSSSLQTPGMGRSWGHLWAPVHVGTLGDTLRWAQDVEGNSPRGPNNTLKNLEAGRDTVCSRTPQHSYEQGLAQWRTEVGEVCPRLEKNPGQLEKRE